MALDLAQAIFILKPLAIFIAGMVVYSAFIWKFYRFLAKRDIFSLDLNKYNNMTHPVLDKAGELFFYSLENLVVYPVLVFFWFLVLSTLLSFLVESQTASGILLLSMALVGAVRITAHISEDLSRDLAKMMPFALLGVFLVDVTVFRPYDAFDFLARLPGLWETLAYYLAFVMMLEFLLRLIAWMVPYRKADRIG